MEWESAQRYTFSACEQNVARSYGNGPWKGLTYGLIIICNGLKFFSAKYLEFRNSFAYLCTPNKGLTRKITIKRWL
jgi:hypothetical protein